MFSRSYSTHIHHMYTCDRQTAETVYHGVKMSLETDPAREHSFFISSPAQTSFAFPLLSMNDRKKIEDSKGDGQLSRCGISSCCWLPGRCLAGFPSWKSLAQTTIPRHYHCTSRPFPPCLSVPWMLRRRQSTVRTACPHSVYLQICFLTQLNSKYHLISL